MHNPGIKNTRQLRNQFSILSTFILSNEAVQLPKYREFKSDISKFNKPNREKSINKMFQKPDALSQLKVDGREINGTVITDIRYKKQVRNNVKNTFLVNDNMVNLQVSKELFKKQKAKGNKSQYAKSHPNIFIEQQIEKCEDLENIVLPEIVQKQSYNTHKNKIAKYKRKELVETETDTTVKNNTKRRQTLNMRNTEQSSKLKMDIKKHNNYIQYKEFLFIINLTNQIIIPPQDDVVYKAYICKGNNGLLVKSIIKTRPWWGFKNNSEIESCNLVWTEWKRNKSMNELICKDSKTVKLEAKQSAYSIKCTNKQTKEKVERKLNNFSKIIGKNTNILSKFDQNILNDTYLTFNNKINNKNFQNNAQKYISKDQYDIFPKENNKKIVNHIPGCLFLHSKKLLFLSMSKYYERLNKDVFSVIPITFLIVKGTTDPEYQKFCKYYEQISKNKTQKNYSNIWICKPGENSNRGNGIDVVSSLAEVSSLVNQKCGNGHTLIVQKYMENPFLYNKRKFDIRCYMLITCVNGLVKGYWYEQGYVRTTSKQYTLKNLDNKLIHLTNDAIQKKGEQYGKFQNFNKVSFGELEKYIESTTQFKFKNVYEKIKAIATDLIVSVARKINPQHKQFTFEIFGLDFMLDDKLNPYLIEANSNPCLEVDGNVLGKVIPPMIENAIRVAIDPIFPPPNPQSKNRFLPGNTFQSNKMFLVYDSLSDFPKEQSLNQLVQAADKECQQFQGQIDE